MRARGDLVSCCRCSLPCAKHRGGLGRGAVGGGSWLLLPLGVLLLSEARSFELRSPTPPQPSPAPAAQGRGLIASARGSCRRQPLLPPLCAAQGRVGEGCCWRWQLVAPPAGGALTFRGKKLRAALAYPSPTLPCACGAREGADRQRTKNASAAAVAPSLVRSTGEGWGGGLLAVAVGCSSRWGCSYFPRQKASSCARLPLPSPPLRLRRKGGGLIASARRLPGRRFSSPNEQRPGNAGALLINSLRRTYCANSNRTSTRRFGSRHSSNAARGLTPSHCCTCWVSPRYS